VAGVSVLIAPDASAQLLYCCVDEKHVRHCSDTLPPKCIGRAYSVRGRDGKMVRDVPPPMTPEQRKAKEELDKKRQQDEIARKEQTLKDKALLATYSWEAEIDKSRDRTEKEIDVGLKQTETKLADAEKKKANLLDKNIIKERMSPEDTAKKQVELDHEIKTLRELLEAKKKDMETVRQKFAEDKRRYIEIKGRSSAPPR
jgi:hypothetical protein